MYPYDIHHVPDPHDYLDRNELLARTIRAKTPLAAIAKANRKKGLGLPTEIGGHFRGATLTEVLDASDLGDEADMNLGVILRLSDGSGIVVRQPTEN